MIEWAVKWLPLALACGFVIGAVLWLRQIWGSIR